MIVIFFTLLQRSSVKNVPLLDGLFIYNKLVIKWVLLEQSVPWVVWSGSALFAHAYLSQYLGFLCVFLARLYEVQGELL